MKDGSILFALPGNEKTAAQISHRTGIGLGNATIRQFPDGESYVRIDTDVRGMDVIIVCSLNDPDKKILPLYFFTHNARSLGAKSICLIAPYLAYMRQDIRFSEGEAVTLDHFARLISGIADRLITIDPHLHRRSSLEHVYTIPTVVNHASSHISAWIAENIDLPVIVGPDAESEQWVSEVASSAGAPYIVLQKKRHGDKLVEVSIPEVKSYLKCTPVLVDDIISTGRTMMVTAGHLLKARMKAPVCIGIHAVFSGNAYEEMRSSGISEIVTCNTIPHESNTIDISDLLTGF